MNFKNIYKSHELFFNTLTLKKLKELLQRADKTSRVLESHINNELTDYYSSVNIVKNKFNECGIYINFFTKNNEKVCHFSIHLHPENNIKSRNGRLHFSNNRNINRVHTLKINKSG